LVSVLDRSEDLTTVGAGAVLAARTARTVRQVLLTTGGVRADHEARGDGLPGRTTVPGVAARHLPLRDSHCSLLYQDRDFRPYGVLLGCFGVLLVLRQGGQAGPTRVDRCVMCVVGVVGQSRTTLGAQSGTVVLTQRLEG
jgi:hypothetical protein